MHNTTSKQTLWSFIDDKGTFTMPSPDKVSRLYFPLGNEAGLLSSITPDLHGDIKTSHNAFLMKPVTTADLHNAKSSRNFWVYVEGRGAWSLTGVSAAQMAAKSEIAELEAGPLWHKVSRTNQEWGLKSEITNFVPLSGDTLEIMIVQLTNIGKKKIKVTPTSAVPIFARSADNLRDHHHVTSLLNRVLAHPAGVVVKPTMSFDERGHKVNELLYAVLGTNAAGELPVGTFGSLPEFIGEGGNLEAPQTVLQNLEPSTNHTAALQGKSVMGALRFKTVNLGPGEKTTFVLLMGIASKNAQLDDWIKKYGGLTKAQTALDETIAHWNSKADAVRFKTQDKNFDLWARWVGLQPTFRKIFGCSFLPDFDYGRGGRGWRDLWQDCLALLLTTPTSDVRELLINNFAGVRIDGSNATIIGSGHGEFIADRNNITRVWMDHGVWPYLTLELYIHQTGDVDILFENACYFRDRQQSRARKKDSLWSEAYGKNLKTKSGAVAQGSILEHVLVQHLVQFYNVGEHNHIRLENADWNDGLDMAYERGESVAFTNLYSSNLKKIADLIETVAAKKGFKKIALAKELLILLDRAGAKKVNYSSVELKNKNLVKYFEAVQPVVSGKKVEVQVKKLVADLREKSESLAENVRKKEWVQTRQGDGFYNGYYDNHGRRVEGDFPNGIHLTLSGQTFAVMSGVATAAQVKDIFTTARKYLRDKEHGGYRLNTNFHEIRPDLGRAFSFAYGEKENGAFFSHMAVMFGNALYQRGFVNEGYEVLNSIYQMAIRTSRSKIYPGIPEYFNSEGRGLYHFLTGSASWYILTLLTQVFGVKGYFGDLKLEPKFTQEQFQAGTDLSVETFFAGRRYKVIYRNPKKIGYEHYCVQKVSINGKELKSLELHKKDVIIDKSTLLKFSKKSDNLIVVTLQ